MTPNDKWPHAVVKQLTAAGITFGDDRAEKLLTIIHDALNQAREEGQQESAARITALEAVITDLCHIPALKVDTMAWLTWDDGQEAAAAGKDLLANPYDPRTPVYAVWVQGWKHGMDEQARKALAP